jgi:hypothetical protein
MRTLLIASVAALLSASPALAWNYSEEYYTDTDDLFVVAYQDDATGNNQLAVECSDLFPDDADIAVYTEEVYDEKTSYADEVPLTIKVDGVPTGPLKAAFEHPSGKVGVVIFESDDERVRPLFETIRRASESIEVSYFDKSMSFPTDNVERSVGNFLGVCNGEANF